MRAADRLLIHNFVRSSCLTGGLYVLLAEISSFLVISWRTMISGSTWPTSRLFFTNCLIKFSIFFPIPQGTLPWQPVLGPNWISYLYSSHCIPKWIDVYCDADGHTKSGDDPVISCRKFVNFGPLTPNNTTLEIGLFWTIRQKMAYPTKYLTMYWTDGLHQIFL